MFWKFRDYILPGKRRVEAKPATETQHLSRLEIECVINGNVRKYGWHTEYDPAREDSYLEAYKDFLDWYTKPAHQRKSFYTMLSREGQRVLKREHIVAVSVTKTEHEVPLTNKKENKEDVK